MIEAYAIGVNLSLRGNLGAEIAAVARQFENLNRIIASSQTAVNELASGMRGLTRLARGAADAWKDAANAMQRAAAATRQAQQAAQNSGGPAASAASQRAPLLLLPAPPSGFTLSDGSQLQIGGGSSSGRRSGLPALIPLGGSFPGGPGTGPMVPFSQNGGTFAGGPGTGGGALVPGGPGGGGGGIPLAPINYPGPGGFQRPPAPSAHEFAAGAAGFGMLGDMLAHLVTNAVNAEGELAHQQSLLRRAQVPTDVINDATRRAWETFSTVPGTHVAENLRMFGELRSQVSSDQQALAVLPEIARMGLLLQNETGQAPDRLAQTVMRVLEQRGQIFGDDGHTMDLEKVRHEMALMYQAMSVSHGLVNPGTFLNFMQQAGPSGMALTPEAFYGTMPTAMQTMGGHRAGTAMASLFSQFVGGVMTQRVATELENLHLLDPNKVHVRRGGQVTIDPGAIAGFDMHNPFSFFAGENSPFQRAIREHGSGRSGAEALEGVLDPKVTQELYRSLGRETTRRLIAEFISLAPTFERDQRIRTQAMNPEAAQQEAQNDPKMRMTQFGAALNGLMVALGGPILDSAMAAMKTLTDVILKLGDFAKEHPTLTKDLMLAAAGVSAFSLAMAALSGVFLVAGPMFAVTRWLTLSVGIGALSVALRGLSAAVGLFTGAGILTLGGVSAGLRALGSVIATMGAAGTTLGAIAAGLAALVGSITAVLGALKLGSDHETPETRQRLEDLRRQRAPTAPSDIAPHDGYGVDGRPLGKRSSYAPPAANQNVTFLATITLDGQAIAKNIEGRIVRSGTLPSAGTTGPDVRAGLFGGLAGAMA